MDIALIYPPISVSERYGSRHIGSVGGHLPPLGLACIGSFLRKNGFSVSIIDAPAMNMGIEDIIKKIKTTKSIGISSITSTFHLAVLLAEKIKEIYLDKLIIIGGHHATILSEEIMRENDCFDILVYGEGEGTCLEIMEQFKKNDFDKNQFLSNTQILKDIKGIVFREKNEIIKNPHREHIENLDVLPYPAWDLLPMDKYIPLPNQYKRKPVVSMVVIRGCPYHCTFCSSSAMFGRKIRAHSPKRVVEQIKYVIDKFGAKEISFWDDMMTVNKNWMNELCDMLIDQKIDITWTCYSRVDAVNRKNLQKMADAGCWNIFYGYESGVQELLNNIKKGITIQQIRDANKWTKESGIEVRASFMIALPGETPQLAQKTIDFAIGLEPEYAQFSITTPYPKTELYDESERWGMLTKNFTKYNGWEAVFVPYGYKDENEILKTEKKAMKQFYLRPKFIYNKIKQIKSFDDFFRYLKGLRFLIGFI